MTWHISASCNAQESLRTTINRGERRQGPSPSLVGLSNDLIRHYHCYEEAGKFEAKPKSGLRQTSILQEDYESHETIVVPLPTVLCTHSKPESPMRSRTKGLHDSG